MKFAGATPPSTLARRHAGPRAPPRIHACLQQWPDGSRQLQDPGISDGTPQCTAKTLRLFLKDVGSPVAWRHLSTPSGVGTAGAPEGVAALDGATFHYFQPSDDAADAGAADADAADADAALTVTAVPGGKGAAAALTVATP